MALSTYIDGTAKLNADNEITVDMSGWDSMIVHLVGASGTISITASNDGGAIEGVTDGNSLSAINFATVQGVKLSDNSAVSVAVTGLTRVAGVGRYVKLGGASAAATKLIIQLNKIS